jgi:phage tail-like protein
MTFPQPRQASPLMPPSSSARRIPPSRPQPPAMTGFWVVVDGVSLPTFTECQGLAAEYEVEPWTELGQNDFVHQLPGRVSYSPVTLTRYVDKASAGLAAWFDSVGDVSQRYRTARISAVDAAGKKIAHWNLKDVFASKYTGPSFSVGGTTAATESVELVHHGFAFTYTAKR